MFNNLLIHPETLKSLKTYLKNPGAPVLLQGKEGSGKNALAKALITQALELNSLDSLQSNPFFLEIQKEEKRQAILITQIRNAIKFLSLKTTGKTLLRRAILIGDAQYMNEEAQNALLKILEEPPKDSLLILTVAQISAILPTVVSRCQLIEIRPLSLKMALERYEGLYQPAAIEAAWKLSSGAAGLLDSLLKDKQHDLKEAVNRAKEVLKADRYERLIRLDKIATDRPALRQLLSALELILGALQRLAITNHRSAQSNQLLKGRQLIMTLKRNENANCSAKLIIDQLCLNLNL